MAKSKSKSKEVELSSKIGMLTKKKNRYKTKLIALRQHAQVQDQTIMQLSQKFSGIESAADTVRNEKESLQK